MNILKSTCAVVAFSLQHGRELADARRGIERLGLPQQIAHWKNLAGSVMTPEQYEATEKAAEVALRQVGSRGELLTWFKAVKGFGRAPACAGRASSAAGAGGSARFVSLQPATAAGPELRGLDRVVAAFRKAKA